MAVGRILQGYFAELVCTFIFCFVVYSAIYSHVALPDPSSWLVIPFTLFFVGTVIGYVFSDITIAHFNPAITFAAMVTGHVALVSGLIYIICQFTGSVLGALMVDVIFIGGYDYTMESIRFGNIRASKNNIFWAEFITTAILVFVVYSMAINCERDPEMTFYGNEELPDRSIIFPFVLGMTLSLMCFVSGYASGGAFNPALIFGSNILSNNWSLWWLYFLAQFSGGLVGALVQMFILFK